MSRASSFLQGVLFGAMIGAALAILLAPSSGEDLRRNMQSRADKIRSDVEEAAAQRRAELEQRLAQLRSPQGG